MNKKTINNLLIYGIPSLVVLSSIGYMIYRRSVYCTISDNNRDKINSLHPKIRRKAHLFICAAMRKGIDINITSALRTESQQIDYYNKGLSQLKLGYHNFGLAFDVVDKSKGYNSTDWKTIGILAKKYGFTWGGNWTKFIDKPHLQKSFGKTINELKSMSKDKNGYVKI